MTRESRRKNATCRSGCQYGQTIAAGPIQHDYVLFTKGMPPGWAPRPQCTTAKTCKCHARLTGSDEGGNRCLQAISYPTELPEEVMTVALHACSPMLEKFCA